MKKVKSKKKKPDMQRFYATDVEVLRFSPVPDRSGAATPSSAHVEFKKSTRVYYSDGETEDNTNDVMIGFARLRRTSTGIAADMTLYSTWKDTAHALRLMRTLYPACEMYIRNAEGRNITDLAITRVCLIPHENADRKIRPLGDKVVLKPTRAELH